MTGVELLALMSKIKAGAQIGKGLYDWVKGSKGDENENAYIDYLKGQIEEPAISQDTLNKGIMSANRLSDSTFSRGIADSQGQLSMQGLNNSVVATQVPLEQQQKLADAQNRNVTNMVVNAEQMNAEKKRQDNLNYLQAKTKLAEMRTARRNEGISNIYQGIMGYGSDLATAKIGEESLYDPQIDSEGYEDLLPKRRGGDPLTQRRVTRS